VREVPAEHLHQFKAKLGRQYLALALLEAEQGASGSARAHAIQSVKASPTLRSVLGAALTVVAPRAIPRCDAGRRGYGRLARSRLVVRGA
jgi:hypothetical protein